MKFIYREKLTFVVQNAKRGYSIIKKLYKATIPYHTIPGRYSYANARVLPASGRFVWGGGTILEHLVQAEMTVDVGDDDASAWATIIVAIILVVAMVLVACCVWCGVRWQNKKTAALAIANDNHRVKDQVSSSGVRLRASSCFLSVSCFG